MSIQEDTKRWIEAMKAHFQNADSQSLNQIHVRGYFSGFSEREILALVKKLEENAEKYPIH